MSDSEDMNANLLDQAALFAVGALAEPEASAFQKTLATSKELQRVVSEYERTAASLADLAPREEPPASLKDRVMAAVDSDLDAQPWKNWKDSPTDPLFFHTLLPFRAETSSRLCFPCKPTSLTLILLSLYRPVLTPLRVLLWTWMLLMPMMVLRL